MAVHPLLCVVKPWLNITVDTHNQKLNLILEAIDEVLKESHGIVVQPEVLTETVSGNGLNYITIPKMPLVSLHSLTIDGLLILDLTKTYMGNRFVLMSDNTFTKSIYNVQIVYESGFSKIPSNLQTLYCILCEKIYKKNVNAATNMSAASNDFGKVSFEVIDRLISKELMSYLSGYSIPQV